MGAAGSKATGTPLAKRLQKKVYNAATTLKRGSNSFFAKVRGIFTRKAAPPSTAERRAKAQKHVNMLERLNKAPKGLNWLRKGYYGVKKLFNKKTLANRIASARGKSILARNRAAQVLGLSPKKSAGFAGAYNVVSSAKSRSGSARSRSGSARSRSGSARSAKSASSRPGSARSAKSAASASPLSKIRIPQNSASAQARMLAEMQQEEAQAQAAKAQAAKAQAAMAQAAAAMAQAAAATRAAATNAGRRSGSRTYAAPNAAPNAALSRLPLARAHALAAHYPAPPRAARSRSGSVSSNSNFTPNG
jgi:hypothetical protein